MSFTPTPASFSSSKQRRDSNNAQSPNLTTGSPSQASQLYFVDRARLPWVDKPALMQGITAAANSEPAYALFGENYVSVIVSGSASAVAGAIWGSHDGTDWVSAKTISALGETILSGQMYAYLVVALDTVTGGNASVSVLLARQ